MINTTDAYQSNTASIPPPKKLSGALDPLDALLPFSVAAPTGRAGDDTKQGRGKSFLVSWCVPSDPAVCLANSLTKQWTSYHKQLRNCQNEFSETSVHQLRVATRRLMAHHGMISSALSAEKVAKARKKLKCQLKLLGELRDAQVQRIFIEQKTAKFPFLALICDWLQERERHLVKTVRRKVQRFKCRKMEQWMLNLCEELSCWPDNAVKRELLAANVFTAVTDAFIATACCLQEISPDDSQTIHRTRVTFKKFRYMVEALSPDFTGLGKRQLRHLGNYQRRMGNLQDLEILQSCVMRFLRKHPGSEELFAPFNRHLRLLQRRALRSCLAHAEDLCEFWDSRRAGRSYRPELIRTAA